MTTESTTRAPVVRFGAFEVDLNARELRKGGVRIKLHGQPFEVLAMLLERSGDLVTREELQQRLWPTDTFVDFDHGVNTAINRLREALGDSADAPRFVETLPRRGYRFVGTVDTGAAKAPELPVEQMKNASSPTTVEAAPAIPRSRARTYVPALVVVAALAVLTGVSIRPVRDRLSGRSGAPPIRALAVLPLENLSTDPEQDFFADGMTEELTTDLGKISALRVISRTSVIQFKGTRKPLSEIGREARRGCGD